jgi:G3E family GTPase
VSEAAPDRRTPLTLLTGFLGSGKTTLLNRLIRHPGLARTAVIINEFGAIGIDHDLVAESSGDIVQLTNGCLCCAVKSDLVTTLFGLFADRVKGKVAPFERVVVETTGLADPAPILLTLFADDVVAPRFRVDGVLTTVDAVNGAHTLDHHVEAVKQAASADRLLLTKLDLAAPEAAAGLEARLRVLNPGCPILRVRAGDVDPGLVTDVGVRALAEREAAWSRWMGLPAEDHHHDHDHDHAHVHGEHGGGVVTLSRVIEQPIAWERLLAWIERIRALKGPELLRIKGLADIAERPGRPLVVHAVQEVFHPPLFLERWPSADRRTRLVFILQGEAIAKAIDESLALLRS